MDKVGQNKRMIMKLHHNIWLWFALVSILWLVFNSLFITVYPSTYNDEAWLSAQADQFLKTGRFDVPLFGPGIQKNYLPWRLYTVGLAQVFRIWGLGLTQARAFSLAGALIGGWLLFLIGQRLYGSTVGVLAGTLYLFSLRVFWLGHVVRPDMWVNAGGLACFFGFLLVKQSRHPWHAFLLGLLAAFIVDIYMIVMFSSAAISLAMLIEFRRRAEWKVVSMYILGGMIGAVAWLLSRLLPDPTALADQLPTLLRGSRGAFSLAPAILSYASVAYSTLTTGFLGYSRIGVVESLYLFAGVLGLLIRHSPQDKYVLLILSVVVAGFLNYGGNHHIVDYMAWLCLAAAATLAMVASWLLPRLPRLRFSTAIITGLLAAPLLIAYVGASTYLGWRNHIVNYEQYARQLRSLVPVGANVLAEGQWWWTLRGGLYTADEYLFISGAIPLKVDADLAVASVLKERSVQVVLLDEGLGFSYSYHSRPDLHLALTKYVKANCRSVGVVEGYSYGVEQGGPDIKRTEVFSCLAP